MVEVERLAAGGDGVARLPDGRTLFVPFSAAGDRARVRIVEERKRFVRGELVELLVAGPARVEPRCALFGRCGGCSWQHLDYAAQVAAKRAILRDALYRIGGFELSEELPFSASPSAYGYRQRARMLVENGRLGFRSRRSHELCATEGHCPVLLPELEVVLEQFPECVRPADRAAVGERGEWEISAGSGQLRVVPLQRASGEQAAPIDMQVGEDQLQISAGVFAQANALLVSDMVAAVQRAALAPLPGHVAVRRVLELYAGAGSLTLGLARVAERVEAVEENPAAARDLVANLRRAALDNVEVRCESSEQALMARAGAPADVIVLDPPRTGLEADAAERLAELGAPRIAYLSCDPATLARDLRVLCARGYRLSHVEGFDLFPQTAHVEALAVLSSEKGRR